MLKGLDFLDSVAIPQYVSTAGKSIEKKLNFWDIDCYKIDFLKSLTTLNTAILLVKDDVLHYALTMSKLTSIVSKFTVENGIILEVELSNGERFDEFYSTAKNPIDDIIATMNLFKLLLTAAVNDDENIESVTYSSNNVATLKFYPFFISNFGGLKRYAKGLEIIASLNLLNNYQYFNFNEIKYRVPKEDINIFNFVSGGISVTPHIKGKSIQSDGIWNNEDFTCYGKTNIDTYYLHKFRNSRNELNIDNIRKFLQIIFSYVSFESLTGGPYNHIHKQMFNFLNVDNYATVISSSNPLFKKLNHFFKNVVITEKDVNNTILKKPVLIKLEDGIFGINAISSSGHQLIRYDKVPKDVITRCTEFIRKKQGFEKYELSPVEIETLESNMAIMQ
ncbi:hypothetical protein, partial [Romboutsia sp.]|uniref:hypothetical protein n=1 Tax=Romboutsia sp. TaxID=1965302 RepID=UPI003F3CA774